MVDLSVKIGGVTLANPVMPASGTFSAEFAKVIDLNRLGALVTKTVSRAYRAGNPPPRVSEIEAGMINSIGLPTKGLEYFLEVQLPEYKQFKPPLVASVTSTDIDDFAAMAREVSAPGVDAIELNISCPTREPGGGNFALNEEHTYKVVKLCRAATQKPLWAKLSPNAGDISAVAEAAEKAGADAITVSNTILGLKINLETFRSSIGQGYGGISGPGVKPIILRMVHQCSKCVKIPIIGCGGIMKVEDVVEYLLAGASAVELGYLNFRNPTAMIAIIEGLEKWCQARGFKRVADLTGAMLAHPPLDTAKHFARAIIMPNLLPPVCTVKDAEQYRNRIMKALPAGAKFEPLMTCYMTHDTKPDEVESGFKAGVFTGVKIYPANVTTNSAAGVSDYRKIRRVIERMERIGMRLLIHGEVIDPEVDVFDREAVFIERELAPLTRDFPGLKVILEHVSSKVGVDFVRSKAGQVGGTITPYHLMLTRTDWLGWGNRPYMYCAPVIKTAKDRAALRAAATSGESSFFLGTDSAPHPVTRKLDVVGAAGVFNSPVAIESYAQVFAEENALDKLEAFTSLNGPRHYGLPPNAETITLERRPWTAPVEAKVDGPDERALIHRGGDIIPWRVVAA